MIANVKSVNAHLIRFVRFASLIYLQCALSVKGPLLIVDIIANTSDESKIARFRELANISFHNKIPLYGMTNKLPYERKLFYLYS